MMEVLGWMFVVVGLLGPILWALLHDWRPERWRP